MKTIILSIIVVHDEYAHTLFIDRISFLHYASFFKKTKFLQEFYGKGGGKAGIKSRYHVLFYPIMLCYMS